MLFNISYLEWIGYVSSVLVAVSLTMSSIVKLRWYNLLGAGIFSFYGFAIGSLPVGLLNLFIVCANIYYLTKIYNRKETFKVISTNLQDTYVRYYLDFNKQEIASFFPKFEQVLINDDIQKSNTITLLLLRDALVAGVFFGIKKGDQLHIHLDFVSASYRDLQPAKYIYQKNIQFMQDQGIRQLVCETKHPMHQQYLRKIGFNEQLTESENKIFIKDLQA
ncbi:MAG: hypothetical protein Q7J05_03720 [Paludibacter sp.]|nr:hypothetical protein [Paludibacter sp.]